MSVTSDISVVQYVYKRVAEIELKMAVYHPPDWRIEDSRTAIVCFGGGGWRIRTQGSSSLSQHSWRMRASSQRRLSTVPGINTAPLPFRRLLMRSRRSGGSDRMPPAWA